MNVPHPQVRRRPPTIPATWAWCRRLVGEWTIGNGNKESIEVIAYLLRAKFAYADSWQKRIRFDGKATVLHCRYWGGLAEED